MFFTSSVTLEFQSIYDVFRAYPDWKLIFKDGLEILFAVPAMSDPDYAEYWKRVQADPEAFKYKTLKDGLDIIAKVL